MARDGIAAEAGALTVLRWITWVVYAIATAAEILLAFMFVFQMIGADPNQQFVAFIYRWGHLFARPFKGIVPPTLLPHGAFIDWNALIAIVAYAVLAWLVGTVLSAISRRMRVDRAAIAPAAAPTAAPAAAGPASPTDREPRA
jgi:uncharacterized protein YggT (Ycf19 family)